MTVALATGLIFARFSRPQAKICFSRNAIIAPYQRTTAFEFRVVNERNSHLADVRAMVVLSRREIREGKQSRGFYRLTLERDR
jgi:inward rectifier potassium channel